MTRFFTLIIVLFCTSVSWAKDAPENVLSPLDKMEERLGELEASLESLDLRLCNAVVTRDSTYRDYTYDLAATYGEIFGLALHIYRALAPFDEDKNDPLHGAGADSLDNALRLINIVGTEWPAKAAFLEEILRDDGPSERALDFANHSLQRGQLYVFMTLFSAGILSPLYTLQHQYPVLPALGLSALSLGGLVYSVMHFSRSFPKGSETLNRNAESHFFNGARRGRASLPGGAISSSRWAHDTWVEIIQSRCEGGLKP